ncbi:MAG: threonine synthase [bacterium]
MTYLTHLECSVCGDRHSPHEIQTVCRSCGKSLLARYDLQAARKALTRESFQGKPYSMWKYFPLLPIEKEEHILSLGEQITPLLALKRLGQDYGIKHLWVKDEGQLPTGSFKARGLVMALSKAYELGIKKLCIPSAGNAAGALAAYAAKAGMEANIFIPEDTPEINIKECTAYGARVVLVKGTISDAAKKMNEERKSNPAWFDVSTLKEPYRLEGKKTMGYELAEQFAYTLPDAILYPTGGGTGLIGMWKAFDEMEQLGWIDSKRPKMISVQSNGCAPVVRAFREGKKESQFWEGASTCASGLRVPKAFADHLILDAVYSSGGCAISVSDEELVAAVYEVSQKEGLFICPEGGAAFAALKYLLNDKVISAFDTVLVFNTASGLKYPEIIK